MILEGENHLQNSGSGRFKNLARKAENRVLTDLISFPIKSCQVTRSGKGKKPIA